MRVSLLEVLISIFAISIGMMGVAALIPVGQLSVIEATKADRSAACARDALAEVKVRNMLDPAMFLNPADGRLHVRVAVPGTSGSTFVIDPLVRRPRHAGVADLRRHREVPLRRQPRWRSGPPLPVDVSPHVGAMPGGPYMMSLSVADRIFTWRDDLVFDVDVDDPLNARGRATSGTPARRRRAILPTDANPPIRHGQSLQPNLKGDYSWLSDRHAGGHRGRRGEQAEVRGLGRRDLQAGLELQPDGRRDRRSGPTASIDGLGYGGGDAMLDRPRQTTSRAPTYLDVRQNEWLMVTGLRRGSADSRSVPGGVAKWYRVVAVDERRRHDRARPLDPPRDAGRPGLEPGLRPVPGRPDRGVVGVYTKTIELDRDSVWNQ